MTFRSGASVAIVAMALAAIGACSDDEEPIKEIAKADLLEQGDAICQDGVDELIAAAESAEGTESGLIAEVLLPSLEQTFADVEALGMPPEDRDVLTDIYDRLDAVFAAAQERDGDVNIAADFGDIASDLEAYGFQVCGQPVGG